MAKDKLALTPATEVLLQESRVIIDSETLLKTPVEELSEDTILFAWSFLDLIEKKLTEPRKKALREVLLETAKSGGEEDEKGSRVYPVEGTDGTVTAQRRRGKISVDAQRLLYILAQKGASTDGIVMVPTVTENVINEMLKSGDLTLDELREISSEGEPTWALVVKKPSLITNLLKGVV